MRRRRCFQCSLGKAKTANPIVVFDAQVSTEGVEPRERNFLRLGHPDFLECDLRLLAWRVAWLAGLTRVFGHTFSIELGRNGGPHAPLSRSRHSVIEKWNGTMMRHFVAL
jgi:hypothetical protein